MRHKNFPPVTPARRVDPCQRTATGRCDGGARHGAAEHAARQRHTAASGGGGKGVRHKPLEPPHGIVPAPRSPPQTADAASCPRGRPAEVTGPGPRQKAEAAGEGGQSSPRGRIAPPRAAKAAVARQRPGAGPLR